MENATKALLIAAGVLIAIVIIALGVTLLNTGTNTDKQSDKVEDEIESALQGTTGDIQSGLDSIKGEKEIKIVSIDLGWPNILVTLDKNDEYRIEAKILPENATNKKLEWSSSNEDIATVVNGTVYLKSVGDVTITAKATDGSKATRYL